MEPTTLAYLAGAIDADGFITIQRTRRNVKENTCGPVVYYLAKLGLSQTERIVPDLLVATFGGKVTTHRPKNKKHKTVYLWHSSNASAVVALTALLPHFRLKRRQAELALELGGLVTSQWETIKATTKPPYRIPPKFTAQRERLWRAVTNLNSPKNRRVHFAA